MRFIPIPTISKLNTRTPNSTLFEEIPTNYDDGITYMEFLLGVLKKLNTLIDTVNTIAVNLTSLNEEVERIAGELVALQELVQEIQATIAEIEDILENHEDRIDDLETCCIQAKARLDALEEEVASHNSRISTLEVKVDAIPALIDTKIATAVADLRVEIGQIRIALESRITELENRIEQLGSANYISTYNPYKGTQTTLQQFINDQYEGTRPNALTAEEYDNLELTAETYDEHELTANEYDQRGKLLLSI